MLSNCDLKAKGSFESDDCSKLELLQWVVACSKNNNNTSRDNTSIVEPSVLASKAKITQEDDLDHDVMKRNKQLEYIKP
jgi:hypothetical protein